MVEAVAEQRPVGELRERVVEGLELELALALAELRHRRLEAAGELAVLEHGQHLAGDEEERGRARGDGEERAHRLAAERPCARTPPRAGISGRYGSDTLSHDDDSPRRARLGVASSPGIARGQGEQREAERPAEVGDGSSP